MGCIIGTAAAPRRRTRACTQALSHLRAWCACVAALLSLPAAAAAQIPSVAPISAAGGRLTISGDASASLSRNDDYYFNYSGYDYSLLRQVLFDGAAAFRVSPHLSLLGDVRVEGAIGEGSWRLRPYAAFVRVRPWPLRAFDVQAGLIPPVFGAFSRRAYGADNPLIGFPLGYQYLTSLRPDALPATADDLLRMRGRGWLTAYPIGNVAANHGVPLMDGLRYQTGVEAHAGSQPIEASVAVTSGSLSVPGVQAHAGGVQIAGRISYEPVPRLRIGASASRGRFASQSLVESLGEQAAAAPNDQTAVGADVEYSYGYWVLRSEAIWSSWRIPALAAPFIRDPLRALAVYVEGRYRLRPGLYLAGRVDRLDFSNLTGTAGTEPWDAPVRRVEAGGGYSLSRNLLLKVVYQYNWRRGTVDRTDGLASAQLVFWF